MLGLIWAQANGGVIGHQGGMPWHLPEDLSHFKATTHGHPVVMGRRTWDSLPRKPLPGRVNIVVSRGSLDLPDDVQLHSSLASALDAAHQVGSAEVWAIGGSAVFADLVGVADRIELTEIDADLPGDTFAPQIPDEFTRVEGEWRVSETGLRYRFVSCHRQSSDGTAG